MAWIQMGGGYNGDAGGEAPIYWYNTENGETSQYDPTPSGQFKSAGSFNDGSYTSSLVDAVTGRPATQAEADEFNRNQTINDLKGIIGSRTNPYEQAQAILSDPNRGYRGLHYALQNGLIQWMPEFGEIIAAGQAGDDRDGPGGLGALFSSGNILESLVDPGNAQGVVKGTLQNLQEGNFADPLGVVDSFRGGEDVQPVDYLGMGQAADTDWLPVGRMMGRMMANVGAAAAMGGGSGTETTSTPTTGSEFTGQFTGNATGNPGFSGTVPGEPGVFTAGAPGTALSPDFFAAETLVPSAMAAPSAAAAGATGSGWAGTATAGTAGAPLAADALSSSSGSPDAGTFSGSSEASSFGGPSGGSSGGGSGSPSGGGSGGSSFLNAGSWMNSIFGQNGEIDWLRLIGAGLPGVLGAFASGSQAEDLEDLAHEYKQMGQPYRTRLEQLYTNPQAFLNSPEVTEPIKQGTDMLARSLSVKGNPAGSGNALQELQNYASTQLFSRLGAEKDRLAGFGGLTQYSAAAPQAAQNAVGAQRGVYDALGGMAADVFNPPKRYRLEDLLRGFNG